MSPKREPLPPRPPGCTGERAPLPSDPTALPPLPDVYHATLSAGLASLGLAVAPDQLDTIEHYLRLLLAWTEAINLTSIREPEAVARDHIVDSLSAIPLLRAAPVMTFLDLGSGGGLPGIPLAIVLPDAHAVLVESVGKKARFLTTAVTAAGLAERVEVAAERAEDLARPNRRRASFDVVTVRAVAALPELIELAFPLLRVGGRLIAWKREPLDAELIAGRNAARAIGGEVDVHDVPAAGLEDKRLVTVTKIRETPARFPRPPAERRAKPL